MFIRLLRKSVRYISKVIYKIELGIGYLIYIKKENDNIDINIPQAAMLLSNTYMPEHYDIASRKLIESNSVKLSVIIPVYNGEHFLDICLNSILNQNTKYNFEVICVDDGSTDNSLNVLNKYSDDFRIKIIHQTNSGISAARNRGIIEAKGEYILFIDNDDFIETFFVEEMLNKAYDTNSDIVKCGYQTVVNNQKRRKHIENRGTTLKNDAILNIYEFNGFCWGMVIKRKLFRNVEFPEGYWYEDMITRLILYPQCKVFSYISKPMYYYRFHSNNASSILWKSANKKSLDQYYLALKCFLISEKLNVEFNTRLCLAYQYELGGILYARTRGLDESLQKAVFILACELNDRLIDKCSLYIQEGNISEKILNRIFINRDFNAWRKVCRLLS